jgi:hypothetical protein
MVKLRPKDRSDLGASARQMRATLPLRQPQGLGDFLGKVKHIHLTFCMELLLELPDLV